MIKEEIKRKNYEIVEDCGIISAGKFIKIENKFVVYESGKENIRYAKVYKEFVPSFQVGIEKDNLIAVAVNYQWESFPNSNVYPDYDLFNLSLELFEKLSPEKIITGNHNCAINCSECCDTPAYDNFLVYRYCKYASEIGWYCLPLLSNNISFRDEICNSYWCSSLREPYSQRIDDGPYRMRPLLSRFFSYSKKGRKEFITALNLLERGENLDRACRILSRYKEVEMYEKITKEIIEVGEKFGVKLPLVASHHFNKKDDFEKAFLRFKEK